VSGGGDVEEDHLVGALLVVAQGEFYRVSHVAQFAGFGFPELHAAGDLPVVNVEARNDAFCDHARIEPVRPG